jgi:hypothetical protein
MSRVKQSIIASLLLALLLLLLAVPVGAQWLVNYAEPNISGVQDANGVYISDVWVTWTIQDDWVIVGGCEDTYINEDTVPQGVDLWCYGTTPNPDQGFSGEVNIVRQLPPVELIFPELKQSTALALGVDRIVSQGQIGSLLVKIDVAETKYYLDQLITSSYAMHAYRNEAVPQLGAMSPQVLLAEALIRVLTPSMSQ